MMAIAQLLSRFISASERSSIAVRAELRGRANQIQAFNEAYYLAIGNQIAEHPDRDPLDIVVPALEQAYRATAGLPRY